MNPIPDTGSGLSGFLAHGLWYVYRLLPSAGFLDWLLLFMLLSLLVHILVIPYLWRSVVEQGNRTDQVSRGLLTSMLTIEVLLFFLWFFHTPGGRTLLNGRSLGTITVEGHDWMLYFSVLGMAFLLCLSAMKSLGPGVITKESGWILAILLLYPQWSVASLTLMLCFVCTSMVLEASMLVFEYILHKQSFG